MDIGATNLQPGVGTSIDKTETQGLASDFETFLKLLTTQIKYQDPLNPADSTEFVAQLATFSSVEQQVQTNDLLKNLAALTSLQSVGNLSSWVGMEVRSVAPVRFEGEPITLFPNIPVVSDRADLVISNSQGDEVGRINLPLGADPFVWDGTNGSGSTLPDGVYSLAVEPFSADEPISRQSVSSFQLVKEAQMESGEPILMLSGGGLLPPSGVLSLRAPGQ